MKKITDQDWFKNPACQKILSVLAQKGTEARFIGGCVRDALLGKAVHDIDIATPELPKTVMKLFQAEGIKVIPTGIDHGTVTVIYEGQQFEITTLRADISTDGRRAVVSFSTDWLEDAKRRDFTFNALSLDRHGELYDPFNGLKDLKEGRVLFIGQAEQRIAEDYLRLLRFFRFSAHYGKGAAEPAGLQACAKLAEGLKQLSGERIAQEILRLLEAPQAPKWVRLMVKQGVLEKIIPHVADLHFLEMMCAFEERPDPLRRLAIIVRADQGDVEQLAKTLRLSKAQAKRLRLARCPELQLNPQKGENHLREMLYRYGVQAVEDQLFIYWAEKGFSGLGPREQACLDVITTWKVEPQAFPLKGQDLIDRGLKAGPELGQRLKEIEDWWCEQGCRAQKEACLERLA
ncbi:Poly(A) polymerase [Candidatus Terasakiella magnetica]|uniref:Poly(A) polymerase n=1 Tax=Candidatus Terasakiella magnetica TaxID=1867952 RepID=A0A1C3RLR3_9PROT|nr:CCA tRNA nucleotidyltransferase [Candidatus Terasakiella magnetica]SCA58211.1 Poly(A) polymerase [Candidatus Terasakiella magnetica]